MPAVAADESRRSTGDARPPRDALGELVADDLVEVVPRSKQPIPVDLVAQHVASTFVLVLNWWVDSAPTLVPVDVDTRFRELIVASLTGLITKG